MANNEQHFRKHWILGVEVLLRPVLARTDQILIVQVSSFAACNHWVPHHNVARISVWKGQLPERGIDQ